MYSEALPHGTGQCVLQLHFFTYTELLFAAIQRRFLGVARGATAPVRTLPPPCGSPNETGCKVAELHNSCIHSVASRSLCHITPLTQSCIMSFGILAPLLPIQMWPPRWPPQTAAARNAPACAFTCRNYSSLHYCRASCPIPNSGPHESISRNCHVAPVQLHMWHLVALGLAGKNVWIAKFVLFCLNDGCALKKIRLWASA